MKPRPIKETHVSIVGVAEEYEAYIKKLEDCLFEAEQENRYLLDAIDKMYVLCIGSHYPEVEKILEDLSTK